MIFYLLLFTKILAVKNLIQQTNSVKLWYNILFLNFIDKLKQANCYNKIIANNKIAKYLLY